jgi:hypothetical protein
MSEQYYNNIIGNPNLTIPFEPFDPDEANQIFRGMIDSGGNDTLKPVNAVDENYNYLINP